MYRVLYRICLLCRDEGEGIYHANHTAPGRVGCSVCFSRKVFNFRLSEVAFGGFRGLVAKILLYVKIHLDYIYM